MTATVEPRSQTSQERRPISMPKPAASSRRKTFADVCGRSGRASSLRPRGVGAGDLVATMIAGARFGTELLWAALLGAVFKLALAEATGRWHLASGMTLLDGWRRLGYWATGFFGVYIVIWGFVYGATAMSAVGLPLNALFGGLSVRYWSMLAELRGSFSYGGRATRPSSAS